MTQLLELAYYKTSQLSDSEQDFIASIIIKELKAEELWDKKFSETQDELKSLGMKALEDFQGKKTMPLNFD